MRMLAWTILAIGTILAAAPAQAQTYDPNYPICLQVYGAMDGGGYIECSYTSLAQCALSAAGRSALCLTNPYYARANKAPPGQVYRRHRRVY